MEAMKVVKYEFCPGSGDQRLVDAGRNVTEDLIPEWPPAEVSDGLSLHVGVEIQHDSGTVLGKGPTSPPARLVKVLWDWTLLPPEQMCGQVQAGLEPEQLVREAVTKDPPQRWNSLGHGEDPL